VNKLTNGAWCIGLKGITLAKGEIIMWYRFSIVATALMLGGVGAAAAELPTYEIMGFPGTPHQVSVVGSAHVQERAPTPTLTVAGMPASPHQIAILTPRSKMTAFIQQWDADHDGMINGDELKKATGGPFERLVDKLFQAADKNRDGRLDKDELSSVAEGFTWLLDAKQ
jgi:hypothetical protein